MIVTELKEQRRAGRVSVFLDQEFWMGIDSLLASELGLQKGAVLDQERKGEIETRIVEHEMLDKALRFLGYRMRTEDEIRAKFKNQYSPPMIQLVIDKLTAYGYVNDRAWLEEMVRSAGEIGKGRRWIEQKAWQAGVAQGLVSEVLADYETEDQVLEALEYCRRGRIDASDPARLWRRLASRGYSPDAIIKIKEALESQEEQSQLED